MFDIHVFSLRLKELRTAKGLSQQALADILGVTKTQISDMERSKVTTSLERLVMLADVLDVSTDYLLGRSDVPERR